MRKLRSRRYATFVLFATAAVHGVTSGTDTSEVWAKLIYILSFVAVLALLWYRLQHLVPAAGTLRLTRAVAAVAAVGAAAAMVFATGLLTAHRNAGASSDRFAFMGSFDTQLNATYRQSTRRVGSSSIAPGPDNCPTTRNPWQENNDARVAWPWIKDGVSAEGATTGGDACDPDDENDGCPDVNENGTDPLKGGQRDSLSPWDFFYVPTPAITSAQAGARNKAVPLADVLAIIS